MDVGNATGILGRQAGNGRAPMTRAARDGMDGFEIGLDSRATARVGAGDGVHDGWGGCCLGHDGVLDVV